MSVTRYSAIVLTLAFCNVAVAQQQSVQSQPADQSRRADRVEERRDQLSENRDERQQNRDLRQADRARDGRDLSLTIGDNNLTVGNNQDNSMDQFIATCLLIGNQEEVELAKLAVERAENENVKQFAQMLVDDHQKAIQKLQQHAKQGMGIDSGATLTASNQLQSDQTSSAQNNQYGGAQDNQASSPQSGQIASNDSPTAQQYTANRVDLDRSDATGGDMDKILKLNQQAAQECLSMTKSMMEEKEGAEFDKAFAGSQIGAHVGMLAKLKASQQHASGELASIIQESEQTVEKHLEEAKQLCKELEDKQASNR